MDENGAFELLLSTIIIGLTGAIPSIEPDPYKNCVILPFDNGAEKLLEVILP